MNVMKKALIVTAEAYSQVGDREKSEAIAETLRAEIDAACREARNPNPNAGHNRRNTDSLIVAS